MCPCPLPITASFLSLSISSHSDFHSNTRRHTFTQGLSLSDSFPDGNSPVLYKWGFHSKVTPVPISAWQEIDWSAMLPLITPSSDQPTPEAFLLPESLTTSPHHSHWQKSCVCVITLSNILFIHVHYQSYPPLIRLFLPTTFKPPVPFRYITNWIACCTGISVVSMDFHIFVHVTEHRIYFQLPMYKTPIQEMLFVTDGWFI